MRVLVLALALIGSPAVAEVKSAGEAHFVAESVATVEAPPAETYKMLVRIGEWWSSAHTYSGDAANMSLDAKAGGCFCETWSGPQPRGGGSVEHGRVLLAMPGSTLRLAAALGPLQAEGVVGTLTWSLKAVDGGTEITQTYVVGGYLRGGGERIAPLVDQVLAEQLAGLRAKLSR